MNAAFPEYQGYNVSTVRHHTNTVSLEQYSFHNSMTPPLFETKGNGGDIIWE